VSIFRRSPEFPYAPPSPHFLQRGLVTAQGAISSIVSGRPALVIICGAVALIIAVTASFLYLKPRNPSSVTTGKIVQTTLPAEPVKTDVAPDLTFSWERIEPAYMSLKIQVGNDNSLHTNQQAVELYGAQIIPRNQICTYRTGERWACGQRAYVALLNIFGASTVDCKPQQPNQPRIVVCRLGGSDIAELMLREGWGNLAAGVTDQAYANAAATAFSNKTGMWRLQPGR
jgi:endonuclease YncB( thermonuclease family)